MSTTTATATAVQREQQGAEETAAQWVTANYPLLCYVVRRVLQRAGGPARRDDVADLAQDASLRLVERWHQFDAALGTRRSWASCVARHVAADLLRTRGAERRRWTRQTADFVAAGALGRAVVDPEAQALGRLECQQAWSQLRPAERAEVALLYAGYTLAEASRRLGIPLATAKTRQWKWRKRLAAEAAEAREEGTPTMSTSSSSTIPGVSGASGALTLYVTTRPDGTPGCVVVSFPDEVYVTPSVIGTEDRRVSLDERKGRLYLELDNATATYAAPPSGNRWARLYQDIRWPYAPPAPAAPPPAATSAGTYDDCD